jgi:hypothetical protein
MLHVGEIFQRVEAAEDKVEVLKSNITPGVKLIGEIAFKTKINGLPNGYPVGVKLDDGVPYGLAVRSINAITREFPRMFMREDVPAAKKTELFIQLLEDLHPEEADILTFAKDQALHELYPWATRQLFEDAGVV